MTAVFVHGVPETPVIWEPLLAELQRDDVVCLHLPGFGRPSPSGFGATKDEYAAWLTAELESLAADGPIDLVGHDWGGGFVMQVMAQRPELARTWVSDVLGLFHPDYVWHDVAQIWQTPGAGEQYFENNANAPVEDRIALLEMLGIPRATGTKLVEAGDEEMGRCILALYRSAAQPAMAEFGTHLGPAGRTPGLAIIAPNDPFVRSHDYAREMAAQLGARTFELEGQGHWWMLGDPKAGAAMLTDFWASV